MVTHAQSIHHVESNVGGWYDTSLTDLGKVQAEKTGIYLKSLIKSDSPKLYSSDLKRAAETAKIIGKHLATPVQLDKRLREMSYGEAEGKPQSWFKEVIKPKPTDGNRLDHRVYRGAETRREVAVRITKVLNDIINENPADAVVVTHGFASTFFIMAWMKVPIEHMDYCNLSSKPACITLLQEDDIFNNRAIKFLSSTTHL